MHQCPVLNRPTLFKFLLSLVARRFWCFLLAGLRVRGWPCWCLDRVSYLALCILSCLGWRCWLFVPYILLWLGALCIPSCLGWRCWLFLPYILLWLGILGIRFALLCILGCRFPASAPSSASPLWLRWVCWLVRVVRTSGFILSSLSPVASCSCIGVRLFCPYSESSLHLQ